MFDINTYSAPSFSFLKRMDCPAKAIYAKTNPTPPTAAQIEGAFFEDVILNKRMDRYTIFDEAMRPVPDKDYRTKANAEWKADFYAEAEKAGLIAIPAEMYERAKACAAVIHQDFDFQVYMKGAAVNVWKEWKDELTGQDLRGELDVLHMVGDEVRAIVEVKKTADLTRFRWDVFKLHYDAQAATYLSAVGDPDGAETDFIWLAYESEPPYAYAFFSAKPETIASGRRKMTRWIEAFQSCKASGVWPSLTSLDYQI